MSNISITSTTDTPEAVTAAIGDLAGSDRQVEKPEIVKADEPAKDDEIKAKVEVDDETDDDDVDADEEPKPKKKGGFKRRIEKLNTKVSAIESEREYWKAEALKAKAEPSIAKAEKIVDGKPKADNFESHEAYVEALVDWKSDQKISELNAKQKESQVKTEHQSRIEAHVGRVQAFEKTHSDFQELMADVDDIPMSLTVQEVILSSDDGPQLMYELAKNRDEFERICKLPAIAAARAMGQFEAKLSESKTDKPEIKTTKAPAPIKPVGSKSTNASTKNPDEMDFQQYKAWRAQHPNG